MAKKVIKTLGEGGAHAHRLLLDIRKTAFDGIHKHLFFVNDRILMTDLSGDHEHDFNPSTGEVGPELQEHRHVIAVRTEQGPVQFSTSEGESHAHELQVNATTTSGVHKHTVSIMDELFISLVPGDLINEVMAASKSIKKFQSLSFKRSDDPMEMDFAVVKKLNQKQYKEILMKGVESLIIKRMTKLGEGLRIESLILSLERFSDVGVATRFVLDQGLDIKSSQVLLDQGVFTFQVMSRSSFEETTLQRIRITEGVEAVIGFMAEKDEPANGNVVASGTIDELTDVEQNEKVEGEINMGLREKFDLTMSKFEFDKRRHTNKKPKKNKEDEETKNTFKCVYSILSKNEEKRLITGPVLIPDNIDLQDDIISANEIEKAAHGYMVKLAFRDDPEFLKSLGFMEVGKAGERGFQHIDFSRKLAVVETFIAPVDFELNGRMILKGTWVMTMKVFDDEVWALVKTGRITGFSIGGRSKSRPAKNKK